jgi:Tfp pilus assembly protein PilN
MRPVNLIPSEQRRGARKPMRGGPLAYIVVGALVAALLGVATLVITNNQISDRKAEIVRLEGEQATVEARAAALDSYTQFHGISEQRGATIASLADSRFDWERVMRELALVLPDDVWLTTLSGSVSPATGAGGSGGGGALRASVAGPALSLNGCARGQEGVAAFVQALKDIDGVTRVGVETSAIDGGEAAGATSGSAPVEGAASGCEGSSMAQFQMVVAFDAAPVNSEAAGVPGAAMPSSTTTTATPSEE